MLIDTRQQAAQDHDTDLHSGQVRQLEATEQCSRKGATVKKELQNICIRFPLNLSRLLSHISMK